MGGVSGFPFVFQLMETEEMPTLLEFSAMKLGALGSVLVLLATIVRLLIKLLKFVAIRPIEKVVLACNPAMLSVLAAPALEKFTELKPSVESCSVYCVPAGLLLAEIFTATLLVNTFKPLKPGAAASVALLIVLL